MALRSVGTHGPLAARSERQRHMGGLRCRPVREVRYARRPACRRQMVERDSYSNSRGNSLMNGIQIGTRKRSRAVGLSLLAMVAFLGTELPAHAAAPARVGQPYAESICNTDPNIIFCEDFNYPGNLKKMMLG